MKRLLLLLIIVFIIPSTALGHILKSDGSIGVLLHINPDDDPIIGEPTTFFVEIKDKDNKLKLEHCDCNLLIYKENEQIFASSLYEPQNTNPLIRYTFNEKSMYRIVVEGKPTMEKGFQPFKVQYDLRVMRENIYHDGHHHNPQSWIIGLIIFLAFVFAFHYIKSNKSID